MTSSYNFNKKCPSVHQYETYLANRGDEAFMQAFNQHLNHCGLCRESVQGYKNNNQINISDALQATTKIFNAKILNTNKLLFKVIKYAASLIILLGIPAIIMFKQNSVLINKSTSASNSQVHEYYGNQHKTLSQKSTQQFIAINSCNTITYNDNIIALSELFVALKANKNIEMIRIEVATNNLSCANSIINSIKKEYSFPVFTIATSRGIKRLTS